MKWCVIICLVIVKSESSPLLFDSNLRGSVVELPPNTEPVAVSPNYLLEYSYPGYEFKSSVKSPILLHNRPGKIILEPKFDIIEGVKSRRLVNFYPQKPILRQAPIILKKPSYKFKKIPAGKNIARNLKTVLLWPIGRTSNISHLLNLKKEYLRKLKNINYNIARSRSHVKPGLRSDSSNKSKPKKSNKSKKKSHTKGVLRAIHPKYRNHILSNYPSRFVGRNQAAHMVYGNEENVGLRGLFEEKVPVSVGYTSFRRNNPNYLDNLLESFKKENKVKKPTKQKARVFLVGPPEALEKISKLDALKNFITNNPDSDEVDFNNGSEIKDQESTEIKNILRRANPITNCSESDSDESSSSGDDPENPGNPFTIFKGKYRHNWLWNHFMDGNHMNINPVAPEFKNVGPSGAALFFGRKWWYFNQDDYKPL